eukprot:2724642-Ditylum_brightwellii.AAC.1
MSLATLAVTTRCCYEMKDNFVEVPKSGPSTAINAYDINTTITYSLSSPLHDEFSVSIAHHINDCLRVSPPLSPGRLESCLKANTKFTVCKESSSQLDGQPWVEISQQGKTLHVRLDKAQKGLTFPSSFPSYDEPRKLIQNPGEGGHPLQDALCSIGEGVKPNAEKWMYNFKAATGAVVVFDVVPLFCQKHSTIVVSAPTLLGNIPGDQGALDSNGRDVHDLLALVSGFTLDTPPLFMPLNFRVPNVNLLSLVGERSMIGIRGFELIAGFLKNQEHFKFGRSGVVSVLMQVVHPNWTEPICQ